MLSANDWASPGFFLLLAAIPLLYGLAWFLRRRGRKEAAVRFSTLAPFRGLRPTARLRLRVVVPVLRGLALAAIAVALAGPHKGTEISPESSLGISIIMAVDRSGSMKTEDFEIDDKPVSRIDAVKKVFRDFVQGGGRLRGRPDDQIGIVSFAGYPVPLAPLTLDHGAVLGFLKEIRPYEPPVDSRGRPLDDEQTLREEQMTAIGDGLALAVDRMKDLQSKSKIIILLSDGMSNFGQLTPEEGADLAKSFGIKVYTIGIGQTGTIMQVVNHPFFGKIRQPVQSELDEETLKMIAAKTGGKYFNAATTDSLEQVYADIDKLERTKIDSSRFYRFDEKFQWAAIPALALLVLEVLLAQTVFRRIP